MTSTFAGMDFNGSVTSPSASPNNTVFSGGLSFESNSDCSSPDSPHSNQAGTNKPTHYNVYQYSATPSNFYPTQHSSMRIPVKLISSTLDDPDCRRKRSGASKNSDQENVPSMHLRRRAQNRASQRAFRERKEKHVKGLEHQLEELHEKHQDLLQSYSKQVDEVSRLNARITQLSAELNTVRQYQDPAMSELMLPDKFDKFDAFPSADLIYSASDGFYDRGGIDTTCDFALHSFEDSL